MLTPLFRFRNSLPPGLRRVFDIRGFAVPVCQGYFSTCQIEHGGEKALLTLISRRRWARAGPRFIKRGIDEAGKVANFAEVSQISGFARWEELTTSLADRDDSTNAEQVLVLRRSPRQRSS